MRQWEREDEGQRWSEERHWNMQLQVSYIYVAAVSMSRYINAICV